MDWFACSLVWCVLVNLALLEIAADEATLRISIY